MLNAAPRYPVWDVFVRLFHWLLVAGFAGSWISAELGNMMLHQQFGLAILALLVFRISWGLVGSETARFSQFVRGPGAALAYLRGRLHVVGHNPIGGWSVVVLLLLMLAQAVSGLMNSDDIYFEGPLYPFVSGNTADLAAVVHDIAFDALIVFVAVHVLAIVVYRLKGKNLVKPMITGYGEESPSSPPAPIARAVLLLILSAAIVWGPFFLLT